MGRAYTVEDLIMRTLFLAFLLSCAVACSSATSTQTPDAAGGEDAGVDDAAADVAASTLKAPTLSTLAPMAGGLHVMWKNNQKDCDAIEGERKTGAGDYKPVFTVPDGTVDNKHDGPLTAGAAYTYRLRCKKGGEYSPYSNEKAGTP